jgi:hypothetical protein
VRQGKKVTDHVRDKCVKTDIKLKHNSMNIIAYQARASLFWVWHARELEPNGCRNLDRDIHREVRTHFTLTWVGHFC